MSESLTADIRGSDLAVAGGLAAAVFAASLLALAYARLEHRADVPSIDPGIGVPIAVRPVADLPMGHAGAAAEGGQAVVPKRWRRKAKAKPAAAASEPELPDLPWSEPEPEPTIEPAPTDAPITRPQPPRKQPTPADPSVTPPEPTPVDPEPPLPDVDAEDTAEQPEASDTADTPEQDKGDDPPEESAGAGQGEQQGDGQGQAEGEGEGAGGGGGTDPLLERAIAFYRARLVAWFSDRFRVSGTGLSPSELARYRVRVHIEIGEDLRILDYEILSSDHPAFETAARTTLDKLRGTKLPPPPENYPGAVQRQLTVTFTCTEDACD